MKAHKKDSKIRVDKALDKLDVKAIFKDKIEQTLKTLRKYKAPKRVRTKVA